ncbi:MAG: PfkB family carbohydrate kinase [Acidobacteriota bacterium]
MSTESPSPLDRGVPSTDRLLELIGRLEGRRVALLADLVADRFLHGAPKRISREAPVLILRLEDEQTIPGGGANAVANVAALGGIPHALGAVGEDDAGRELLELFERDGIGTRHVLTSAGYRTPTKTRVMAGGRHAIKQQVVRYDVEDRWRPSDAELERLGSGLEDSGPGGAENRCIGAAVLSDYGYGAVTEKTVAALRSRLPGVPLLGDSRYSLGGLGGLDGATPNLEEAEELIGGPLETLADLEAGGRELLGRLGARFLLITRGSSGMSLFERGRICHLPVHGTDQVADVTGAGDTVIGSLALALAAGATPLEAACLANYAGGVVVMKVGTATLSRDELRAAARRDAEMLSAIAISISPPAPGGKGRT